MNFFVYPNAMLLAASVYTTQNARLRARWKIEGGLPPLPGQKVATTRVAAPPQSEVPLKWTKEEYRFLPSDHLGPTMDASSDYPGTFVVYDWDTRDVIWRSEWEKLLGNPAGYCFADGQLYMNDFEAGNIFRIGLEPEEPGKLLQRISHPYFNDLHSLERTKRGLLAAACGTDLVVEIDLQGNVIWEWWAAEHGYDVTPSGDTRPSGRGGEHRNVYYHTRYQSTHVNCAVVRDPEERFILALLFHQGILIQIDRSLPPEQQKGQVILEGLARPHSLEKIPDGWIFCNSLSKELVLLDDNLKVTGNIFYDGGWIQDCTRLPNGNIVLNDVDNTVLVEFAAPDWEIVSRTNYPSSWRMGELVVVPAEHEEAFLNARNEKTVLVAG